VLQDGEVRKDTRGMLTPAAGPPALAAAR
jgi:hypothetical protein